MKGFDPKFTDFPDYIIRITHEIWEDRGVHTLHDYYAPNVIMRSSDGLVHGCMPVIKATTAAQATWPDRQLLGEDVIWSGSPEDGMLSSHRIFSTATGVDKSGAAAPLAYRVVADCHAKNNQIDDEWLVRDQGVIARQLGYTPREYAQKYIDDNGGPDNCQRPFTPADEVAGPYKGIGNSNEWGQRYADILNKIMSHEFSVVAKEYDRACQLEQPSGKTGHSHHDAESFWMGLRACFPSATFSIDHQIGREDPLMSPRAAIRWSLHGKHEGVGMFGAPSGADVYVMGICHAEFGPWGLRREYVLIDEVAIWKQILLAAENT